MIAFLKGIIYEKKLNNIILNVNNVGYEIHISFQTYQQIKDKGEVDNFLIHTIHKDDTFQLYGFKTEQEQELFRILLSISGIGPKMALSILSKVDIETFKKAVSQQNLDLLTGVGGIGKKRAEKLLFELKEKFKKLYGLESTQEVPQNRIQQDAILGLEGLGYSKTEAMQKINQIPYNDDMTLEELIKRALAL